MNTRNAGGSATFFLETCAMVKIWDVSIVSFTAMLASLYLLCFATAGYCVDDLAPASLRNGTETTSWAAQPNRRGTFQLILSCLLTLVLCVWTAVHLNVPLENATLLHRLATKTKWVLFGVFAPELVVYNAYVQYARARWLDKEMKALLAKNARNSTRRNSAIKAWTTTHSFLAVMGGFAYKPSADPGEIFVDGPAQRLCLSAEGVHLLACVHQLPFIREEEIQDKSKADTLAKTLVCLQALWMMVQLLGRLISHLPITLLEINTMGHVFCALIIYSLWWKKPLDIREPFILDTRKTGLSSFIALMWMYSMVSGVREDVNGPVPEIECIDYYPPLRSGLGRSHLNVTNLLYGSRTTSGMMTETTDGHTEEDVGVPQNVALVHQDHCEMWNQTLRARWKKSGHNNATVNPEPHVVNMSVSICRRWTMAAEALDYIWLQRDNPASTRGKITGLDRFQIPYNMFRQTDYIYRRVPNWPGLNLPGELRSDWIRLVLSIATASYGGLHAAAWNSHFPSTVERWTWIASSLFISVSGFIIFMVYGLKGLLAQLGFWGVRQILIDLADHPSTYGLLPIPYALARIYLVVEAFVSLRNVPITVYDTPAWTQLIPHL